MSFPKFRNFQITEKRLILRKTNVIFGLSAPKNIKKHQKINIKKTKPKICCPVIALSFFNELGIHSSWVLSKEIPR